MEVTAADLAALPALSAPTQAAVAAHGWALPERLNMAWEACDRWAEAVPDRPAIVEPVGDVLRAVTYGRLRAMADGLARDLAARGVVRGARVGVFRGQAPWTAAAHIAIWKLGAVSVPLFPLFGVDALAHRISDAGIRWVIKSPETQDALQRSGVEVGALVPETLALDTAPFETAATGPEDPAVLIYTSGTTGKSKGALHGHRVLRGHLPGVELSHDLLPVAGDVLWTPADWAWIGGLFDVLMPGLYHAVPVVAARMAKFSAEACAALIAQAGVRNVFFPPTALRVLKAAEVTVPGLRSVASGGEPLGPEMAAWGRAAFGVSINEFYGQTECNMTVSSCAALYPPRPGCIGKAVPGHHVEVIGTNGRPAVGEGDIAVARGSASMFLGFHGQPAATAARFRGDWLLTGDRGRREDGYIRFLGREDDVITSAGYRIGPGEVEDCLLTHPAVASVGVVGLPDPARTERVAAFVVVQPGWDETDALVAALQAHVKTALAAHAYPREVRFVASLPMTVTGKILRRALRAEAMA